MAILQPLMQITTMAEHGYLSNNQHIKIRVQGPFGLFTTPCSRARGEKISYPVPTASALAGILRSVCSSPSINWVVEKCRVMSRIRYTDFSTDNPFVNRFGDRYIYQCLQNCDYIIYAYYKFREEFPQRSEDFKYGKYNERIRKFLANEGQRDIYLGCREFRGYLVPVNSEEKGYYDDFGEIDLGIMFHSYQMPTFDDPYRYALLSHLTMKNGIIEYPKAKECELRRRLFKEIPYNPKPYDYYNDGEDESNDFELIPFQNRGKRKKKRKSQ